MGKYDKLVKHVAKAVVLGEDAVSEIKDKFSDTINKGQSAVTKFSNDVKTEKENLAVLVESESDYDWQDEREQEVLISIIDVLESDLEGSENLEKDLETEKEVVANPISAIADALSEVLSKANEKGIPFEDFKGKVTEKSKAGFTKVKDTVSKAIEGVEDSKAPFDLGYLEESTNVVEDLKANLGDTYITKPQSAILYIKHLDDLANGSADRGTSEISAKEEHKYLRQLIDENNGLYNLKRHH